MVVYLDPLGHIWLDRNNDLKDLVINKSLLPRCRIRNTQKGVGFPGLSQNAMPARAFLMNPIPLNPKP